MGFIPFLFSKTLIITFVASVFLENYVESRPHIFVKDGQLHLGIPFLGAGGGSSSSRVNLNGDSSSNGATNTNTRSDFKSGNGFTIQSSGAMIPQVGTSSSSGTTHFSSSSSSSGQSQGVGVGESEVTITIQTNGNFGQPQQTSTSVQTDNRMNNNENNEVYFSSSRDQASHTVMNSGNSGSIGFGAASLGASNTDTLSSSSGGFSISQDQGFNSGSLSNTGSFGATEFSSTNQARSIESQTNYNSAGEQDVQIGISAYPTYSTTYDTSIGDSSIGTEYSSGSSYIGSDLSSSQFDSVGAVDAGYIGGSFDTGYTGDCISCTDGIGLSSGYDSGVVVQDDTSSVVSGSYDAASDGGYDGTLLTSYDATPSTDTQIGFDLGSTNYVRSVESESSWNSAASGGDSTGYVGGSFGTSLIPTVVYTQSNDANSGINSGSQFSYTANEAHSTETHTSGGNQGTVGSGFYLGGNTNYQPSVAVQSDVNSRSSTDQSKVVTTQQTQANGGTNGFTITIHTKGGYVPPVPATTNTETVETRVKETSSTGVTKTEENNKVDIRLTGNSESTNKETSSNDVKTNINPNTDFSFSVASVESKPKPHVTSNTDTTIEGNLLFPGLTIDTHKRHIPSGSASTISSNSNSNSNGIFVTASEGHQHHHHHHPPKTDVVLSVEPAPSSTGFIGGSIGTGNTGSTNVESHHHHHHTSSTDTKGSTPALVIPLPILTPFISGSTSVSSENTGSVNNRAGAGAGVSGLSGLGLLADTLANGFSFGFTQP